MPLEVVADAAIADWDESDDGNADDDEDLLELKIKTGDPSSDYDALFDMVDPIEAAIFEFQETADEEAKKTEASNEYRVKPEYGDEKPNVSDSASAVSIIYWFLTYLEFGTVLQSNILTCVCCCVAVRGRCSQHQETAPDLHNK